MTHAIDDLLHRQGWVTTSTLAKALGVSRQAAHRQLAAAVAAGRLQPEGQARARRYLPVVPRFSFDAVGLSEERVLAHVREQLGFGFASLSEAEHRLLAYVLTEMVNNAIDHARAARVSVSLDIQAAAVALDVVDDGIGAFASVQAGRGLANVMEAAAEITKGKVTTMPERHSGEGVFFSSKAVDHFELSANGLALVVDNSIDDLTIRATPAHLGTTVRLQFSRPVVRSLQAVFAAWTDEFEFTRTRTVVRLFGMGRDFVSRSEARRILQGLESFREVIVDFHGVAGIGQGFADEVFRVWALQHPAIRLVPTNMVDEVRFFVERAERARR
jgi:anti-sigma regulatory factor (Ser/Thr protein kinase)